MYVLYIYTHTFIYIELSYIYNLVQCSMTCSMHYISIICSFNSYIKMVQDQQSCEKHAQPHSSLGKWKLKPRWSTASWTLG